MKSSDWPMLSRLRSAGLSETKPQEMHIGVWSLEFDGASPSANIPRSELIFNVDSMSAILLYHFMTLKSRGPLDSNTGSDEKFVFHPWSGPAELCHLGG
jgi:hypothetical protein